MATVHPITYFNIEDKITNLAFLKEKQLLVGTASGKIQIWNLKSESISKTLDLFSEKEPILWICVNEGEIIIQARFSQKIKILDMNNFDVLKNEIEISQGAVHFCKGNMKKDSDIFAVPIYENGCEIIKNYKSEKIIQAR